MAKDVGLPIEAPESILFTLKDVAYTPEAPRMNEPFIVKGKVELLSMPFLAPVWVIVTVEYPETWWEEIIPIIGAPQVRQSDLALGGDFEVTFEKGFVREGEFKLTTKLYAGPTMPIDKLTLPPFPPVASEETTFMVAGEAPPEEIIGFRALEIISYGKNEEPPVAAGNVLELEVGDKCRVNVRYEHKGDAVTKILHSSIGDIKPVIGFDEIISNKKTLSVAKSEDWGLFEAYIDIPITTAISPGDYDLYFKIDTVVSPFCEDVIRIVGVPVWEMVQEIPGIVIKLGPPVAVWEMVQEITGIIIKTSPPVAVWEMVEEVAGIIIKTSPPVAVWEMVEEVAGIVVELAPRVGITFQVSIWGIPDFGLYHYWACYYWDPGISDFVNHGEWYHSYDKRTFSNVQSGGYFAVFLRRNSTVSRQYTSPTFAAVDGGIYQYDVQLGRVTKIS